MSWNPPGIELGKRTNGSGLHNRTYIVNIHYPHTVFITENVENPRKHQHTLVHNSY